MNRKTLSIVTLTLAALAGGNAMAADASTALTRDQVSADWAQAQRTGDIVHGETGAKLNELLPGRDANKS
jgi:hypothetical protein